MNMIEGPIYPHIKVLKGRERPGWSGNHWKVDVGRTMMATENRPHVIDGAVLAVSRNIAEQTTGRSAARTVVNKAFRPPLIAPVDRMSWHRRPNRQEPPRTNPRIPHGMPFHRMTNEPRIAKSTPDGEPVIESNLSKADIVRRMSSRNPSGPPPVRRNSKRIRQVQVNGPPDDDEYVEYLGEDDIQPYPSSDGIQPYPEEYVPAEYPMAVGYGPVPEGIRQGSKPVNSPMALVGTFTRRMPGPHVS